MRKKISWGDSYIDNTKVIRIEEKNTIINDKYKTVFYCESKSIKNGRLCIIWGHTLIDIGDIISMKGIYSGETFIAESLRIKQVAK